MNIGVNAWVWTSPVTTAVVRRLAPQVREMGYDLLEIPLENVADCDHREAAAILRDHDLGVSACVAMGPDRDLIHPDVAIRNNGMAYVRDCIAAAAVLGADRLAGPLYSAVGRTWTATPAQREREITLLSDNLRSLAEAAGDAGVTLALEPLNRFETSFINTTEQALEVVDRVDHPAMGLLLDTFHMNIEERSPGEAIRRAGRHVAHIHACGNDRGAPGAGPIDWPDIVAALREINYGGAVVVESFTAAVQSIARAAAIWRPLAPSQDALAAAGIAFLRPLFTAPVGASA